jgi:hypothetical protein
VSSDTNIHQSSLTLLHGPSSPWISHLLLCHPLHCHTNRPTIWRVACGVSVLMAMAMQSLLRPPFNQLHQ